MLSNICDSEDLSMWRLEYGAQKGLSQILRIGHLRNRTWVRKWERGFATGSYLPMIEVKEKDAPDEMYKSNLSGIQICNNPVVWITICEECIASDGKFFELLLEVFLRFVAEAFIVSVMPQTTCNVANDWRFEPFEYSLSIRWKWL